MYNAKNKVSDLTNNYAASFNKMRVKCNSTLSSNYTLPDT